MKGRCVEAWTTLQRVQTVLRSVRIRQGTGLEMRHMTARVVTVGHSHPLVAEGHVHERLLVVMVPCAATVHVVVLALQLVLDPLTVRRVTDKRKNRADTLNEEGTLSGLSVVERSLE